MPRCPKTKTPVCPECGGEAYRTTLRTRPVVYGCDACGEFFTVSCRVPMKTLRELRTKLVQRWDQLADDAYRLVQDMQNVPAGAFGPEWQRAIDALDGDAFFDVFTNYRPRLPGSLYRRALDARAEARRRVWLETAVAELRALKAGAK